MLSHVTVIPAKHAGMIMWDSVVDATYFRSQAIAKAL
jgi:hypothetical protein